MGWMRAHKYDDKKPDKLYAVEAIETEVMNALCEVIEFSEGD